MVGDHKLEEFACSDQLASLNSERLLQDVIVVLRRASLWTADVVHGRKFVDSVLVYHRTDSYVELLDEFVSANCIYGCTVQKSLSAVYLGQKPSTYEWWPLMQAESLAVEESQTRTWLSCPADTILGVCSTVLHTVLMVPSWPSRVTESAIERLESGPNLVYRILTVLSIEPMATNWLLADQSTA